MKWTWLGLETAPCAETQTDPQERGLPQQPRAGRLPLLAARIYLDLRRRERQREGWSRGWRVKRGRGWARVRERRKREGRHLNKTRSDWCLHDKGARHLPWLVSQCGTKAMQPPRGGVMCGAQACLCIQGVILGRDRGGPLSSFGVRSLCAYSQKEKSALFWRQIYNFKWKLSPKC